MNDEALAKFLVFLTVAALAWIIVMLCSSCTISFQNISTNGKAQDLVDETQDASPETSVDAKLPLIH